MKKISFSLVEKKLLRMVIILALIQLVIIFIFLRLFRGSQQVNANVTKQIDIIIDDIYCYRVQGEYKLFIVSNATEYLFDSRSTFEEYSVSELYESISKGDKLSLMYYRTHRIFGTVNLVVDARSESETYRTLEEYNKGRKGVPLFVVIAFFLIEIVYVGIVFVYVWINCGAFKGVYRTIRTIRGRFYD